MSGNKLEFLNSPEEKLQTWDSVWKMMLISGAATLGLLALLGIMFL